MTNYLPDAFLFMRVGNHAGEAFADIVARKRREIDIAGYSLWGYGGPTLHPLKTVQPFARLSLQRSGAVALLMEPMDSRANPEILPANEMSRDGVTWERIPEGIQVTGSKYALVLDRLEPGSLDIPLAQYEVAIGPSAGKSAADYVRGRVDKGCFVKRAGAVPDASHAERHIGLVAAVGEPFAVMLR